MAIEQPGLEKRMGKEARRISSQHRQLDVLYGVVADALQRGDARSSRAGFERFCDALDAHFSLEEGFYFPALHGMRPELGAELAELAREHGELRALLEELRPRFDGAGLDGCAAALDAFAARLARHEGVEERLVARIRGPVEET
jgi:hypothetical protein